LDYFRLISVDYGGSKKEPEEDSERFISNNPGCSDERGIITAGICPTYFRYKYKTLIEVNQGETTYDFSDMQRSSISHNGQLKTVEDEDGKR
jgi:hypothetical protein